MWIHIRKHGEYQWDKGTSGSKNSLLASHTIIIHLYYPGKRSNPQFKLECKEQFNISYETYYTVIGLRTRCICKQDHFSNNHRTCKMLTLNNTVEMHMTTYLLEVCLGLKSDHTKNKLSYIKSLHIESIGRNKLHMQVIMNGIFLHKYGLLSMKKLRCLN